MISETLQQAIDELTIDDVYLHWSRSECTDGFYPKEADYTSLAVQHMHAVRRIETFDVKDAGYLLRVFVLLGLRWVASTEDEDDNIDVKAFVEADFIAEYRFHEELDADSLNEFAFKNTSHSVWPYWREYLSSELERLRLPRVTLPTMQLAHHRR